MIIGFDAKRIFHNTTGLGNYSRCAVESLAKFFPQHQYFLFTPSVSALYLSSSAIKIKTPASVTGKIFPSWWRSKGMLSDLAKNRIEIYHGLSNELPIGISKRNLKSVVSIHDLIFMKHPLWYQPIDRKIYEAKVQRACREANQIVVISEQTKNDLLHFFKVEEGKISIVYQSIGERFFDEYAIDEIEMVKRKYKLPGNFLVMVGTVESRKNHLTVLRALSKLKAEMNLLIISRKTKYISVLEKQIQQSGLGRSVFFRDNVSNEDLPLVYRASQAAIYLSMIEGFGLPIAEAQASEVPVIASNIPVFHETGGEGCIFANPDDADETASLIEKLFSDSDLKNRLTEKGKKNAQRFLPQTFAEELMNVYMNLDDY